MLPALYAAKTVGHTLSHGVLPGLTSEVTRRLLDDFPSHRLRPYAGVGIPGTIRMMGQGACGPRGEQHIGLIRLVRDVVRGVRAKDYPSELAAIYHWTCRNYRYTRDPVHNEYVEDPIAFIERGFSSDCFTLDTKVVVKARATGCYQLRSLEYLKETWPAFDALSYDFVSKRFVFKPITGWQSKGHKEVWQTHLANGGSFRHTPDHRVWWYEGAAKHQRKVVEGPLSRGQEPLMPYGRHHNPRLLVANKIPALGVSDYSRAQLYLSGMSFPWDVISASEDGVRVALEAHGDGDAYRPKPGSDWAKKVSAIHATSSADLCDQLQLMAMILGEGWHTQLQLDHMGEGRSPIFRFHRYLEGTKVASRQIDELPGLGYSPLREQGPAGEAEVCDISVADTHNFVLSNGLIAHNCDDVATFLAACAQILGNPVRFVTVGFKATPSPDFSHVFCEAYCSRANGWVTLDPVAGPMTKAMKAATVWCGQWPIDGDMGKSKIMRLK